MNNVHWTVLSSLSSPSPSPGMTSLKLIERNVPKDKIAMLSIPMIPVKIIITIFLTRYLVGYKNEIINIFPKAHQF